MSAVWFLLGASFAWALRTVIDTAAARRARRERYRKFYGI